MLVWMVVCLYMSALQLTGDLPRVSRVHLPSPEDAEIGQQQLDNKLLHVRRVALLSVV